MRRHERSVRMPANGTAPGITNARLQPVISSSQLLQGSVCEFVPAGRGQAESRRSTWLHYFKVVGLNRKNTPVSMPITKIDRLQYSSCASSLLVSEIFIQCFSQVEATMDKRPDNHLIKTCKGDYKAK